MLLVLLYLVPMLPVTKSHNSTKVFVPKVTGTKVTSINISSIPIFINYKIHTTKFIAILKLFLSILQVSGNYVINTFVQN